MNVFGMSQKGTMTNIFITSDSHFGHIGVTKFLKADGTKLRPWDSVEEMDEALVSNWNSVVGPKDKVYHLGDVVINRKALKTLARLNGDKVLIKGNHDLFRLEEYTPYFRDIRSFGALDGFALTHVPIHPDSLGRWNGNWHGHLHSEVVMTSYDGPDSYYWGTEDVDKRYMCMCVEQTNFTPISLEDAKLRWEAQQ
jgi:calcineurin-like phosphoesterase family protein